MYCLSVIHSLNERATSHGAPALTNRDCSFNVVRSGLILHSALHRNTVFVGRETPDFPVLAPYLKRAGQARVNACIEAYFNDAVPTAEAAVALARKTRTRKS